MRSLLDPRAIPPHLLQKYDVQGPRYTSYPPAPHFKPIDPGALFLRWRARNGLGGDPEMSVYVHIPFCEKRCGYCEYTVVDPATLPTDEDLYFDLLLLDLVLPKRDGFEILREVPRLRPTLPVIVRDSEDQEALEISLIENLQREDLNPMEEAEAFQLLMEQFSQTQEALATRLGKDRSTLANTLRLLRLPSEIRDMVRGGSLSAGHARSLLSLATPEEQLVLAREILEQGLSVRQVEDLVKRRKAEEPGAEPKAKPEPKTKPREEFYLSLERSLGDHLGTGVAINERRRRIVIDYLDEADLQRILGRLAPTPPTA